MATILTPTSEAVVVSWLRSLSLPVDAVGTTLPEPAEWARQGALTVHVPVDVPDLYTPTNRVMAQIDAWCADSAKKRPPWGRANSLAQLVVNALWTDQATGPVTLANGLIARVISAWCTMGPRRIESDPAYVARYSFTIALLWAAHTR